MDGVPYTCSWKYVLCTTMHDTMRRLHWILFAYSSIQFILILIWSHCTSSNYLINLKVLFLWHKMMDSTNIKKLRKSICGLNIKSLIFWAWQALTSINVIYLMFESDIQMVLCSRCSRYLCSNISYNCASFITLSVVLFYKTQISQCKAMIRYLY